MNASAPAKLPTVQTPTQFLSVGGTQLPLPPDARPELSYLWTERIGLAGSVPQLVTVPGHYYDVPFVMYAQLVSSSASGDGVAVVFIVEDASPKPVLTVVSPQRQAYNTNYNYAAYVGGGAAYATSAGGPTPTDITDVAFPIPPMVVPPSWQWGLTTAVDEDGLQWGQVYFTSIRIPSGSPTVPAPPSTPTLRLV